MANFVQSLRSLVESVSEWFNDLLENEDRDSYENGQIPSQRNQYYT
ncbi:MAG: hypothetical protein AAFV98_00435 [Chloroflexota bacterium]